MRLIDITTAHHQSTAIAAWRKFLHEDLESVTRINAITVDLEAVNQPIVLTITANDSEMRMHSQDMEQTLINRMKRFASWLVVESKLKTKLQEAFR